jgi:ankyrin repeat protein
MRISSLVLVSLAACASQAAPSATPPAPSAVAPPRDDKEAFFDAVRRGDDDAAIAALQRDPSLANARTAKGSSAFAAALARMQGKHFVRPQDNRALAAVLALHPTLDAYESAAAGDVARVEAEIARDPAFPRTVHAKGWTALHFAAFGGQPRVVEILLAHGADINRPAANRFANAPLQVALLTRQTEVVRVLIAHGADVRFKQSENVTALHEAAQSGDVESAKLLLEAGADPNVRTGVLDDGSSGLTALDIAKREGHADVVALLARASAR